MSEHEFPHLKLLFQEIEHCLSLADVDESNQYPSEQSHIDGNIARFNKFFKNSSEVMAIRTYPHLPLDNERINNGRTIQAIEEVQWKKIIIDLNLKPILPAKVIGIEHFYGRPFPITGEDGKLAFNLVGTVILAKENTFNDLPAISVDIMNLCTMPKNPDRIQMFSSMGDFQIVYGKESPLLYTKEKDEDETQWQPLDENTAENFALMQIVIVTMLHQLNNGEGYDFKKYQMNGNNLKCGVDT